VFPTNGTGRYGDDDSSTIYGKSRGSVNYFQSLWNLYCVLPQLRISNGSNLNGLTKSNRIDSNNNYMIHPNLGHKLNFARLPQNNKLSQTVAVHSGTYSLCHISVSETQLCTVSSSRQASPAPTDAPFASRMFPRDSCSTSGRRSVELNRRLWK